MLNVPRAQDAANWSASSPFGRPDARRTSKVCRIATSLLPTRVRPKGVRIDSATNVAATVAAHAGWTPVSVAFDPQGRKHGEALLPGSAAEPGESIV